MVKRKYKIRKKNKYKKKCGKGFGDGFIFLYSLGSSGVNQCNEKKKKLYNDET